ncbi:hypothetical protein N7462_011094 [Penicillium macrosclerotiorum]|uniref:uncharacterized protein n=1 Tax=Penicillium macrosclerotiorum TaxID=303699 RepID=UPI00254736D4|nr:uncharacterized protein N7462_011094 [Penicillium macrosclerotiorum]KAJ5666685.1 hypothetical protein N7462_011094 [Penicillium macrosclerotiorum]
MSNPRPSKRQRIYRACDQCRRRKSKCDGEQPVCKICHSANRACTYESGGGRRGLQSGYVRSLEIVLGLAFRHIPNSEGTIRRLLRESRAKDNFLASDLARQSLLIWQKSKLSREVSHLLTSGSGDNDHDDSDWEAIETRNLDESMDDQIATASMSVNNDMMVLSNPPQPSNKPQGLGDLPVPDITPDLLEFYFTYTHCWFPILERRNLLRAMHISSDQLQTSEELSSRILLWAVISYVFAMEGKSDPTLPTPSEIQIAILQQISTEWKSCNLNHVHTILIFVLTHISAGNFSRAWTLVAQATRTLMVLPLSNRKGRFLHTFHGCVFLDNILSALLGKTPCISSEEQSQEGLVEEDDVDEWDVWSQPRSRTLDGERIQATPLRALSSFNLVRQLMQYLSQISYQSLEHNSIDDILEALHEKQAAVLRSRPYNKLTPMNPPLLILHLTSSFTTLSLIRKFESVSAAVANLCIRTIHHMLEILELYLDMAEADGISPLVHCFAVQCLQCLGANNSLISLEKGNIERKVARFMQIFETKHSYHWKEQSEIIWNEYSKSQSQPSLPLAVQQPGSETSVAMNEESSSLNIYSTLPSHSGGSIMTLPDLPRSSEDINSTSLIGQEAYDALFEEMVTSFPSTGQEPLFAHNLGFYDGDLDTDFLAQLQQPPAI